MTFDYLPGRLALKYGFIVLTFLLPVDVGAVMVADIYAAQIPVMNESEAERKRGIRAGLAEVVVKASGRPAAITLDSVKELLDSASLYVSEYQYVYPQPGEAEQAESAPTLDVKYLEAELETVLRRLQLPVWPADRPLLMLWVTKVDGPDLRLLGSDEPAYRSLATLLARRGVRIEMPLSDLKDQMNLGDIGADSGPAPFALATERYQLKYWLHVNYQPGGGVVSGTWQLSGRGKVADNRVEAGSLTGFMVASADQAVEYFSRNFSYAPAETRGSVSLVVENVLSYGDYRQVVAGLKALELVRGVQVSALRGTELKLDLHIEDEAQRLFEALDKDDRFTYVAQVGASSDRARRYVWGGQ